jgi:hypothetical protein
MAESTSKLCATKPKDPVRSYTNILIRYSTIQLSSIPKTLFRLPRPWLTCRAKNSKPSPGEVPNWAWRILALSCDSLFHEQWVYCLVRLRTFVLTIGNSNGFNTPGYSSVTQTCLAMDFSQSTIIQTPAPVNQIPCQFHSQDE